MDTSSNDLDRLIGEWLSLSDVADRLGVSVNRLRRLMREREVIAVTVGVEAPRVPAEFLDGDRLVKGLGGTLTLLADSGFDDHQAVRWLFTPDETLPGRPIDALRERRGKEVRRRAQALAL